MGDAPALRDVELKKLCELFRCLFCNGISPGAEGNENLPILAKGHIAVHHGTETNSSQIYHLYAVLFLYIFCHLSVGILQTVPDHIDPVCPDAVYQLVLPLMAAGCDRLILIVHQNRLNTG